MKIFGREPVIWLGAISAVLAVLVTVPSVGLTADAAAWVMVIVSGVFAAVEAAMTRPFVVAALTGSIRTILTGLVFFGLPLAEETSGAIVAALNMVLALVLANSVTPASDPAPGFVRAEGTAAARPLSRM